MFVLAAYVLPTVCCSVSSVNGVLVFAMQTQVHMFQTKCVINWLGEGGGYVFSSQLED